MGFWVVWPWEPISARDPVKCLCKLDLPEFGGPIMASWAAPSGRTVCAGPDRAAPFFGPVSCSASCLIRLLISLCRCSVPLCLGIVRSISLRQTRRSPSSFASRKACSAFLYSGLRLAGIVMRLCTKEQAKPSVIRLGFATHLNCSIDNPVFRGIVRQ